MPVADTAEPDSDEQTTTVSELLREQESVPSASFRPGLRKLNKREMHERLVHTGEGHNCEVCRGLRAGRPHRSVYMRRKDPVPGRTVSMDTIVWKARGRNGEKYTTGMIDDRTNFIWHFEQIKKSDACEGLISTVLAARSDPEYGREDLIKVIRLDNAGEWDRNNKAVQQRIREALAPHVPKLEYRGTMISSKYNAMGEVCMRIIEEMTKAVMLTTRLETELRPLATEYAVRMHNLTAKRIRTGPDGN